MRIVHIIPNLAKGGAERLCLDICNELSHRDSTEVLLIILNETNEYYSLSKDLNIKLVSAKVHLKFLRKAEVNIDDLNNFINLFSPDIIHSHLYFAELHSQLIESKAIRFCHLHDNVKAFAKAGNSSKSLKQFLTHSWERNFYLKKSKKNRTFYIAISKDTFHFAIKNLPHSKTRTFMLPNAINVSNFPANLNRNLYDINLCVIGSLIPIKGHYLLIETIHELKHISKKNISLDILGDGPEKENLMRLRNSFSLESNIFFHGKVDNPEKFLSKSNLYVFGTVSEAFGLTMIEAMSTGLPVISTDGKGNRDFMDGSNGILLNHRDPKLFAQEILSLIEDNERYLKLQKGALQTAAKYDIKPYVDRLLELYQKAIDGQ